MLCVCRVPVWTRSSTRAWSPAQVTRCGRDRDRLCGLRLWRAGGWPRLLRITTRLEVVELPHHGRVGVCGTGECDHLAADDLLHRVDELAAGGHLKEQSRLLHAVLLAHLNQRLLGRQERVL